DLSWRVTIYPPVLPPLGHPPSAVLSPHRASRTRERRASPILAIINPPDACCIWDLGPIASVAGFGRPNRPKQAGPGARQRSQPAPMRLGGIRSRLGLERYTDRNSRPCGWAGSKVRLRSNTDSYRGCASLSTSASGG